MALIQFKNNAKSLTTDNPLTAGATTVNVTGGTGAKFPAGGDFLLTIWDAVTYPDPSDDANMEVVRATARSTDAITITRAQEGTTGVAHAQGSKIAMLITAGTFSEFLDQALLTTSSPTFAGLSLGTGGLNTVGTITPAADSTYNLGSSAPKYFANAYIDTVLLNSTATLGGGTAGVVTITGALTATLDVGLVATKKIYLDGVARTGNTYIYESSADTFDLYVGGTNTIKSTASLITLGARVSNTNGMPDYWILPVQSAKVGHLTYPATIIGSGNRYYLSFEPDTDDQSGDFQFMMPFTYNTGQTLTVKLMWVSTVASNNVIWNASIMAMTSGDAALLETDSFDTANATTTAASGTAGRPVTTSITMTNKDSVAAGDIVTLRITRDADNASDTNTGNAKIAGIILEYN